jgi:hypothetical protein
VRQRERKKLQYETEMLIFSLSLSFSAVSCKHLWGVSILDDDKKEMRKRERERVRCRGGVYPTRLMHATAEASLHENTRLISSLSLSLSLSLSPEF